MTNDSQSIAQGLRRRDVSLLQQLAIQYQHRLIRYLVHLTGQWDRVEDLVQEIWVRVLEKGGSFKADMQFEPWLFRIARNLAVDQLRRRPMLSLAADHGARTGGEASPYVLAARTEDARRLATCLKELDRENREVIMLRFQEELSLTEIALIVEKPVPTVASMIYRSMAKLRSRLEDVNDEC